MMIREAKLAEDRGLLIRLLQSYLSPQADQRRFDWLYSEGPHGRGRAWIASDGGGDFVGVAAAFPRQLCTAGGRQLGWVLGDFCILPQHRSLGPALALQRACLDGLGKDAWWYDFPSSSMTAVYRRLGIESRQGMVRMVRLLRSERKLASLVRSPSLARILAVPANRLLRLQAQPRTPAGIVVGLEPGPYGEEFSALAAKVGARYGTCVLRSAEFLNWRYRDHPRVPYEILAARRDGTLLGYLVFAQVDAQIRIVDLFGFLELEFVGALLAALLRLARRRRAGSLSAPLLPCQSLAGYLRSLGFRPRESVPVMMACGDAVAANGCQTWFLSDGDRES